MGFAKRGRLSSLLSRLSRRLRRHPYRGPLLLLVLVALLCVSALFAPRAEASYERRLALQTMRELEREEGGIARSATMERARLDTSDDDFGGLDAGVGDSVEASRGVDGRQGADGEGEDGEDVAHDEVDGASEGEVRGSASVKGWVDDPASHNLTITTALTSAAVTIGSGLPTRPPRVTLDGRTVVRDMAVRGTPCYAGEDGVSPFCAPALLVAGMRRTSASALFYKLSLHSGVVAADNGFAGKEACPDGDRPEHVWKWLQGDGVPVVSPHRRNARLVTACYDITTQPSAFAELVRLSPDMKIVVVLRNFADWAYSDFSYRCREGYDGDCSSDTAGRESWRARRTAANFHEIVTGRNPAFRQLQLPLALYRPWLEKLVVMAGREKLIVVRQEDLAFQPRSILESVAEFGGMDVTGFADEAFSLVSNAQSMERRFGWLEQDAGVETIESMLNTGSDMYEETRTLLDDYWKGECEWLRDQLGVRYPEVC